MSRHWTIGSAPDSDLVVNVPSVSGRHCRLSLLDDGYSLEDLGSTNGTFVNGIKLTERRKVSPADTITLGLTTPMPWPPENPSKTFQSLSIGREPDNDIVVPLATISGHHARVIWEGRPGEGIIEDLGSANGTALQTLDRKVTRAPFTSRDTIYLGTYPLLGAHLLARLDPSPLPILDVSGATMVVGRDPMCHYVIDLPIVSSRHATFSRTDQGVWIEDLGSVNGTFVNGVRIQGRTAVTPGDVIAFGSHSVRLGKKTSPPTSTQLTAIPDPSATFTGTVFTHPARVADRVDTPPDGFGETFTRVWKQPVVCLSLLLLGPVAAVVIALASRGGPEKVPTILLATGISAFGFGLANAIAAGSRKGQGLVAAAATFCSMGLMGLPQSVFLWGLVSKLAGLEGSWAASLGILVLAASVGLAIGLVIASLAPSPKVAVALALLLWVGCAIVGGGGRTPEPARPIAGAAPTRWVYEGMLHLNADPRLVENDFPAATDRMGLRADLLALTLMLIGFTAAGAFMTMTTASESGPLLLGKAP